MGSASAATHVVVTCANRKRFPIQAALLARSLARLPVGRRAGEWVQRLSHTDAPTTPALDLYAGEHWSVVRSIPALAAAARRPISLWILSAGYGLISSAAPIRPYAATFCAGHADSVASNGTRGLWWGALSAWSGPEPGAPRSLTQLAKRDPSASIVVAVSPPYLEACADDLAGAAAGLDEHAQLSVICTGASSKAPGDHLLPGDARLQHVLGGTRQALNVRVLAHLIKEHRGPLTHDNIAGALDTLLSQQPDLVRYDRARCSDAEVTSFIRTRLRVEPSLSRSRLLREFRNSGKACEQSRFAELFETVSRP